MACIGARTREERDAAMAGVAQEDLKPTGPQFGPVYLTKASKAIMQKWYYMARNRMRGKTHGKSTKLDVARAVSSDDENDDVMTAAPWAREPVRASASTVAIARKWLQMSRVARAEKAGAAGSTTMQELDEERVKRAQAPAGSKSRYSRK